MVSLFDLPAYTKAHVSIGLTCISFGALAVVCQLPIHIVWLLECLGFHQLSSALKPFSQRLVKWHSMFGSFFVVTCFFMPITSNWIWPRLGTPKPIVVLILGTFSLLVFGLFVVRLYKWINQKVIALELLQEGEESKETSLLPSSSMLASSPQRKQVWLKYLHALSMILVWYSIIGAGQAFLGNSRTGSFPYTRFHNGSSEAASTDMLIGRCYDRNLTDTEAPSWLTNLDCGLGAVCNQSTYGGVNPTTWPGRDF